MTGWYIYRIRSDDRQGTVSLLLVPPLPDELRDFTVQQLISQEQYIDGSMPANQYFHCRVSIAIP